MEYDIEEVARRRHDLHKNHASSRPLSVDYELVGLAGEVAFADQFGFSVDLEDRPEGDGRFDFDTPAGTVDIKTARKAFNLLREADKDHAEILILARYDDQTKRAKLLGWEFDSVMRAMPVRDFGYGIKNHYKPAKDLKSMKRLTALFDLIAIWP